MQILDQLRERFAAALFKLVNLPIDSVSPPPSDTVTSAKRPDLSRETLIEFSRMLRPTSDTRHGDYQANCAMPLAKLLGRVPREVAQDIVDNLQYQDLCAPPEIAGPGFINLRLKDELVASSIEKLLVDDRVLVPLTSDPKTIVVDYSGPNVAKPMHVGHIRSTVIGDAIAKVLRFLGHRVITDNHLGDWGTQFGMVIYGFKHFVDQASFDANPVAELSRLYRLVNRLIEYHAAVRDLEATHAEYQRLASAAQAADAAVNKAKDPKERKVAEKNAAGVQRKAESALESYEKLQGIIQSIEAEAPLKQAADAHPNVGRCVLEETVKLHEGDKENLELWNRFLPHCKDEINRIYHRLGIQFDHVLGESFYHPMLQGVVDNLRQWGLAQESEGAICVFLPEFDAPMIVQKRDGAFLYATTDLATLFYRRDEFAPDEVLYVVDSRQSEHFEKLFAAAAKVGLEKLRLVHVNFGTVLGPDGRPFKTRSGSSIGLEALLNDAVERASQVVCDPQRASRIEPPLTDDEKQNIANVVGHGAIKYADLSHHRASDYRFDLEKMVSLDGNTSAYVQYAYARVQGILVKGDTSESEIIESNADIQLHHPAERALAIQLLRMGESLDQVRSDYAPNFLVDYLYETAKAYAVFNDNCPVLKADSEKLMQSRLALATATGRVIRQGLELLGIGVVPRM